MSDGLRWQEVFGGAEEALMTRPTGGVRDTNTLRQAFWRATPAARREALFPFVWTEIARRGQIWGNQSLGSVVRVSNGKNFSYPGYNELICGVADPRIDSNDKRPNPNTNVFEWLHGRPGFRGRVAVLGTWDDFPYIFNVGRSRLPIWPAWEPAFTRFQLAVPPYLNQLERDTPRDWDSVTYDSFLYVATAYHVAQAKPRVVFIGFGETDEWAHAGRYDQYLTSAHRVDDFVRRFWTQLQAQRQYRDKTTFILTADHGRGSGPAAWRDHGEKVEGADGNWLAVIGPDTPALGERTQTPAVTLSQVAATLAALLGEDFNSAAPRSGAPIRQLLPPAP